MVDQLLILFGKPSKVTAVLSNSRTIGHPDVPDAFIIHCQSCRQLVESNLTLREQCTTTPRTHLVDRYLSLPPLVARFSPFSPRNSASPSKVRIFHSQSSNKNRLFRTVGTKATFIKHGLDVQEAQLIAHAADALTREDFAVEPKEIHGQLYTLDNPSKSIAYVSILPCVFSAHIDEIRVAQHRIGEGELSRMV